MTVFRKKGKKRNFVVLDKRFLEDADLTWQAKGMLSYMLSLPDDWCFRLSHLKNQSRNGRDATYTIIRELREKGYIRKTQERSSGKFGQVDYDVMESPLTGNPDTEKPDTEKPDTENPTLLSNKGTKELSPTEELAYQQPAAGEPVSLMDFCYMAFGKMPTVLQIDKLHSYVEDGLEEEVVRYAVEIAGERDKKINYAYGILNDWMRKNITTKAQAQQDTASRGDTNGGTGTSDSAEKTRRYGFQFY